MSTQPHNPALPPGLQPPDEVPASVAYTQGGVFTPPEGRVQKILDHLDSAFSSLADVASNECTTVEALSAWLMLPQIQDRNRNIDSAAAQRSRSLATRNLHIAVAALSRMIQGHIIDDEIEPYDTATKSILARARLRDVTRKACFLLLRIAKFDPTRTTRPRPNSQDKPHTESAPRTPKAPAELNLHELRAILVSQQHATEETSASETTSEGATARRESGAAVEKSRTVPASPSTNGTHKSPSSHGSHESHSSSASNGHRNGKHGPAP